MKFFGRKLLPAAVRLVELSDPIRSMVDVEDYQIVRIYVTLKRRLFGMVEIYNYGHVISAARLRRAIADNLSWKAIDVHGNDDGDLAWAQTYVAVGQQFLQTKAKSNSNGQMLPSSQYLDGYMPTWLIDLSNPLEELVETAAHDWIRLIISWRGKPLGSIDINNRYQPLTENHLRCEIANHLGYELLLDQDNSLMSWSWAKCLTQLAETYLDDEDINILTSPEKLPETVPVSVVIATLDRPDDLYECLLGLANQETRRQLEIIVVDNNPDSGLTSPVVAQFDNVRLVQEHRGGLSYARNAGICASTGEIVIATDDDVIFPPDWLERLVAPFARQDVMIVTGNVLPRELGTKAEQLFETYGGLGRGFERFEVNRDWFEHYRFKSVPTWHIGATANAAFRASIFHNPDIGMMDETLGAGSPTGCSEDTYIFYKVLKAGYTILYEPEAYVWHKHRRTMEAFRKQLYAYSKGAVAYHLILFQKHRDWRGLFRIFFELPFGYVWQLNEWLQGRTAYSPSFILLEMRGSLAGFWALWKSRRRVKRMGRSQPYIPLSLRGEKDQVCGSDIDSLDNLFDKMIKKRRLRENVIQVES